MKTWEWQGNSKQSELKQSDHETVGLSLSRGCLEEVPSVVNSKKGKD